jgi:hypothetical protein
MPLAGQRPDARMAAHVRWAERYARQRNMPKALAHFGRALEFGNTGSGYKVAIKVYVDRAEVEANKRSHDKPFLFHAANDIRDVDSGKILKELQCKLELELLKSVSSRERPVVRIEIYDSGDVDTAHGGHRGESGVYIEVLPSGRELSTIEEEEIKSAIRRIVPNEIPGVSGGDIRSIDALRKRESTITITLRDRDYAKGADDFLWKRNVSGVLDRYIQARCGICARVELWNNGTYHPNAKRPRHIVSKPIRMEVLVKAGTTDEQKNELEEKLMSCMPGIRSILGSIYVVGPEEDDKIEISIPSEQGEETGSHPTQ